MTIQLRRTFFQVLSFPIGFNYLVQNALSNLVRLSDTMGMNNSAWNAIEVESIIKIFLGKKAVDNISFSIPFGKITALLGSNGAGKSTTLNIVTGIMNPTSGNVVIDGMTYEKNYKDIKQKMGFLTCDMALYETLSVYECLKLFGGLKGMSRVKINDRIEELSTQFEIRDFMDKHFGELSSGQKKRSLIACSVIHDPQILIFDEVTASLDVVIAKQVMDFLIGEKKKGKAVIFATHILSEVEYISDHILMIEHGKLIKSTTYPQLVAETGAKNLTEAFCQAIAQGQKAA
jgi:sodium transport system ATP-binding protein